MASDRNYSKKSTKKMADGGGLGDKVKSLFGMGKPKGYKSALDEKREAESAKAPAPKTDKVDPSIGGAINAINQRKKLLEE